MLTLEQGDCIELLKKVPDESVDLICADLPYGTTQCRWDTPIPLEPLWEQIKRVITHKAAVLMFAQTPFDKVLGASNLPMLKYEWVWEKGNATGFLNAKKAPLKAHENILVFCKTTPIYNPVKSSGHIRKTTKRQEAASEVYGKGSQLTTYDSTDRYPRSVIRFSSDKQVINLHPTQKPLRLMEYLIKTYSKPGDTVLDPCMGSGTTGVAAHWSGRSFIGFESDSEYFKTASHRIQWSLV